MRVMGCESNKDSREKEMACWSYRDPTWFVTALVIFDHEKAQRHTFDWLTVLQSPTILADEPECKIRPCKSLLFMSLSFPFLSSALKRDKRRSMTELCYFSWSLDGQLSFPWPSKTIVFCLMAPFAEWSHRYFMSVLLDMGCGSIKDLNEHKVSILFSCKKFMQLL